MSPEVLVRIANLTVVRKPGRAPKVHPDPLATTHSAAAALRTSRVGESELAGLRELHELVVDLVDRLLNDRGLESQAARLTALAAPSRAQAQLDIADGQLRQRLEWTDPSLMAGLARRMVLELGAIAPDRLRRCGRPECDVVFYDSTRSNTQRWHAESPCGHRERQRRHRAARSTQANERRT